MPETRPRFVPRPAPTPAPTAKPRALSTRARLAAAIRAFDRAYAEVRDRNPSPAEVVRLARLRDRVVAAREALESAP